MDRPVPFLAVHGTADRSNYFDGGLAPGYNEFPVVQALAQSSIPERVANVALRNGCQLEPAVEAIGDGMERWAWACPRPREAIEMIWEIFARHPMPE